MNERITNTGNITTNKSKKEWKKFLRIYFILAILFLVMFTMRATVTILQVFVPDMTIQFFQEGEEAKLTIIFTIYNMSAAVISLFAGPLSGKIGYKRIIYTGMIIFAGAMTLSTFAISFWMLALGQSLGGIGAALFGPLVIAYASDYFPKEKSSTAIGVIMSSFYVATIILVPINSYIADLLDWRWGVGIMAIISLLVAILIILFVPRIKKMEINDTSNNITNEPVKNQKSYSYINRIKMVLKNRNAIGTFFITLFQRGGLFAMTALLSTWMKNDFNIEDKYISGLILMGAGVAALTSNTLFSWLADRFKRKRLVIIIGTSLTCFWIGIFPVISVNIGTAIFGFILVNFFGGIAMGSYNAFVAEVEPEAKGTTVSINNTFGQFSIAIAVAIISTVIYDRMIDCSTCKLSAYSYSGFMAMGFLAIAVILMIIFVRPKNTKISNNKQHKINE